MKKNQLQGVTKFQAKVYRAALKIPYGMVTTYKILGEHIGCHCYQAIGQALAKNPFAPRVPCHRIIASDLSAGGFMGEKQGKMVSRKLKLLKKEGVTFKDNHLQDNHKIFFFT